MGSHVSLANPETLSLKQLESKCLSSAARSFIDPSVKLSGFSVFCGEPLEKFSLTMGKSCDHTSVILMPPSQGHTSLFEGEPAPCVVQCRRCHGLLPEPGHPGAPAHGQTGAVSLSALGRDLAKTRMVCCWGTEAPARSRLVIRRWVSCLSSHAGPHFSRALCASREAATHSFHTHRHRSHSQPSAPVSPVRPVCSPVVGDGPSHCSRTEPARRHPHSRSPRSATSKPCARSCLPVLHGEHHRVSPALRAHNSGPRQHVRQPWGDEYGGWNRSTQ